MRRVINIKDKFGTGRKYYLSHKAPIIKRTKMLDVRYRGSKTREMINITLEMEEREIK